jgi:enamidase
MVEFWAGEGATSFKAYMQITRAELKAAAEAAHSRGLKITGHLCSVTYREAADLGIDNLEHGFFASTDFAPGKALDRCPQGLGTAALAALDPKDAEVQGLLKHLVNKRVAITSTLTVFETSVPGQPQAPDGALEAMHPDARAAYQRNWTRISHDTSSRRRREYTAMAALEREFVRLGGLLVAGTDPTGYGGVVAGYSNQRQLELLVDAGFAPLEAIRIATLNGATYLGRADRIGSLAEGKDADIVLVTGNPAMRIADVRNVELVFKKGVAYDSKAIFASVKGTVGWR